jgi:tetratricopeptide (TPR) repeat protein
MIALAMPGPALRSFLRGFALAAAVLLAGPAPAAADIVRSTVQGEASAHAAERDRLFRFLAQAQNARDGFAMEIEVWRHWLKAPDTVTAELMNKALERRRVYDFSGALVFLDAAVAQAPGYAEAWNQRATIRFEREDFDGALADIEATLRLEPKHFGAMAGQAIILMRQGRFDTAQDILRRAVAIHPFLAERAMIVPLPGLPAPAPDEKGT